MLPLIASIFAASWSPSGPGDAGMLLFVAEIQPQIAMLVEEYEFDGVYAYNACVRDNWSGRDESAGIGAFPGDTVGFFAGDHGLAAVRSGHDLRGVAVASR